MNVRISRNFVFYLAVLALFGTGIYLVLHLGAQFTTVEGAAVRAAGGPAGQRAGGILGFILEHLHEPLTILLIQIIVIVATARLLGKLFRHMGQPAVLGEMLSGIVLGPSLLGWLSPAVQTYLFPPASLGTVQLLAQLGVIFFMFIVGMELDVAHLRANSHATIVISHASIIFPFFLGTASALVIYPVLVDATVPFSAFALFIGVAMSITAFPVLARIIEERGLARTPLGSKIIGCAAVDDVTAWCLLAVVVAIISAEGPAGAVTTVILSVLFVAAMVFLVRPPLGRLMRQDKGHDPWSVVTMAALLLFVLASALVTELIGIHALFGAFLAGTVMPISPDIRAHVRGRVETFGTTLLLPLFFAYTGLRTQIGLLNDLQSWLFCVGIIVVAIVGKFGGSFVAARWTGMDRWDSVTVGIFMNTRGLIELIALNIGYELGVLSPQLFTMMVLMALVTTFLTGPLLSLAAYWKRRHEHSALGTSAPAPLV